MGNDKSDGARRPSTGSKQNRALSLPAVGIRPTPFSSTPRTVCASWIDHNGHMNVANYLRVFDDALGEALVHVDLGPAWRARSGATIMTGEVRLRYARELLEAQVVHVETLLLNCDERRTHWLMGMLESGSQEPVATAEWLNLVVDLGTRRVISLPPEHVAILRRVADSQAALPRPADPVMAPFAGRSV